MKEHPLTALKLSQFSHLLKPRLPDSNKGNFGRILVVGGDYGFSGAPRMAGEAALRVGAGLVSIATRPENALVMNADRPELMCHGVSNSNQLTPLLEKATVVILGPGLGQNAWSQQLFDTTLKSNKPLLVIDADGLNLLSTNPIHYDNWILTPHPGEAAKLLKTTAEAIQHNREKTKFCISTQSNTFKMFVHLA